MATKNKKTCYKALFINYIVIILYTITTFYKL
jgi:hypothetical protein